MYFDTISFDKRAGSGSRSPVFFFIPGWGFLGTVFSLIDGFPMDVLYPKGPSWKVPETAYIERLETLLREERPVHLAGWSLGAGIALSVVRVLERPPKALWLISLRRTFPGEALLKMRELVEKDKADALRLFYRDCFRGQERLYRRFKRHIEGVFIECFKKEDLVQGLDWLRDHPVYKVPSVDGVRTILVHGGKDSIAPLKDMPSMSQDVQSLVLEHAGHMPFMTERFKDELTAIEKGD